MVLEEKYEPVIGLEVHIQLLTKSKAFSSDSAEFGADTNTNVSVISLGHPGVLPKINEKMLEYGVRLGLACNCNITRENEFARKNYFYADLPKGYQISQHTTPVCTGGYITVKTVDGQEKPINLTRIHMEEDSGKSLHDQDPFNSLIDLNRAGVPLLEMVSEPEIKSPEEAYQYLAEVRKLVRYLDICDGNMEEGSLRCDANVSVKLKGAQKFGEKVEVKNMNSIRNVQRALEYEITRQISDLESNRPIHQETRSFDPVTGKTSVMRTKEMADDYRYFPEPDLPKVIVTEQYIEAIKKTMPRLPGELYRKYTEQYGLSVYDASVITDSKATADFFEKLIESTQNHKAAANWIMGPVKSYLNANGIAIENFPVSVQNLAALIQMVDEGIISFSGATANVFHELAAHPEKSPMDIIKEKNLVQDFDENMIRELIQKALDKYPDKVAEYKNGKKGLAGLFMGEVMKLSKGKADPNKASILLQKILETI